MIFKVPSNPNHSVILWFYEIGLGLCRGGRFYQHQPWPRSSEGEVRASGWEEEVERRGEQRRRGTTATVRRARRGSVGVGSGSTALAEGRALTVLNRHFRPRRFPAAPSRKGTAVAMARRGQVCAVRMRDGLRCPALGVLGPSRS